jgi:hypothetical protein
LKTDVARYEKPRAADKSRDFVVDASRIPPTRDASATREFRGRIALDLFFESGLHSRSFPTILSSRDWRSQPIASCLFIRSVEWSLP